LALAATVGLLLGAFSASAGTLDSFTVYVGYADNLRPSGFFPGPWIGSTFNGQTVISQTPAGSSFDSGAIRIDNSSSTSITISNLKVSDNNGTVVFQIWNDLTLAAGQTGVFAQTNGFNFDSSDQGLFGGVPPANLDPNNADGNGNTNLIGGCSSDPSFITPTQASGPCNIINAPVISFTENGNSVSFIDSGFILNTGEYDFVNNSLFGEDGNESINWNTVGGNQRGGSAPEPGTLLTMAGPLVGLAFLLRKRLLNRQS
jgi:hypothetical protein